MTQADFQLAGVLMSSWKPSIVSRIKSIWYEYGFLRIMHKNDQKSFLLHFSYSSKWIASTFQRRASNPLSTSVRCLMVNFRSPCGSLLEARRPSSGVPPWPPLARKGLLVQLASNWRLQSTVVALGLLTEQPRVRISTLLKFSRWSSKCSTPLDCLRLWKRHSSPQKHGLRSSLPISSQHNIIMLTSILAMQTCLKFY